MRLQVPKFFQTINPSLPFRHRSLIKTVPPEEDGALRPGTLKCSDNLEAAARNTVAATSLPKLL